MAAGASVQVKRAVGGFEKIPRLSVVLFNEVLRTRVLTIGAAVAFYSLMSMVPLLMVSSALLSALPIPDLFNQLVAMLSLLVPPDAMNFVIGAVNSIQTAHPAKILSIGILSYAWAASGCFTSLIEALNIAYDVKVERSWWRDRVQALLLTLLCGGLALFSLLIALAGPHVISFLARVLPIPYVFTLIWPPLRWALIFCTFVTSVMLLYTLGPNRKVSFRSALPGAMLAVSCWFLGSVGLTFYIGHFSDYSATYGSLGVIIILMLWLYLTAVSILVGAELNAELWKQKNAPNAMGAAGATAALPVARSPDAA